MHNLEIIEAINQAKGNEKIDVIQQYKCISHILKYAYDPFKKFYISAPDLSGVEGGTDFTSETKQVLDQLSERTLSGGNAFETVCDHTMSLCPKSAELFKRILNKDLRCGINVKTINKAIPGLIPLVFDGSTKPPVMLLKTFAPQKVTYPCLAAVKKDGVRGRMVGQMLSRQGHKLIGHSHIEDELQKCPHDFDGELCVPGLCFDEASGLIRNDDPTPNSVYWIFDIPSMPGTKQERYAELAELLFDPMNKYPMIQIIPHFEITNEVELKSFYKDALSAGEEGIVIYDPDSEYIDGRPGTWTRLVPIQSEDCPVIGFFEGKGKHAGSLGGIIVDYKGHKVRVGTGFSEKILKTQLKQLVSPIDKSLYTSESKKLHGLSLAQVSPLWLKIRQFIWDNREEFLGVIAKLEFKEKTKAGSLRQPRFKTWRFDKG